MKKLVKKESSSGDSARSKLFGGRSKKSSSPTSSENPYAASPGAGQDPYAVRPPPSEPNYGSASAPGGGYTQGGGAYGQNQGYGSQSNYGAPPARTGGYGGLGPVNDPANPDANRQALFGDTQPQHEPSQQSALADDQSGGYGSSTFQGYGNGTAGGYGAYGDRQLTEEEQEEEDIQATKNEIKFIKQQDVSSTRNALRLAQQAEESGRQTLERLGEQGERIHNTDRNLDLAASGNRVAEEKAAELKTLNKSMFHMHVSNPFTASSRREERDAKIMDTHRREKGEREATRAAAYDSKARKDATGRELRGIGAGGEPKRDLAQRAKYQFEADSDDDAMEDEIDSNLDALHGAAGRLKGLAGAMGKEVESQNERIDIVTDKTDRVDDQVAMNRARLARFK